MESEVFDLVCKDNDTIENIGIVISIYLTFVEVSLQRFYRFKLTVRMFIVSAERSSGPLDMMAINR